MKILRLRLRDYRGVKDADLHFAPVGATVVEGPNEAGKTSLAEALGILFDYPDSSHSRDVKGIKPVHHDAGTEIELEAESGAYAFTYFKRFHKKPETTLTVTKPRQENLTGRPAHERAEAILRETIDTALWRALNLEQGKELHQADLRDKPSLSAALDRSAGGLSTDSGAETLFDTIRKESGQYYTEQGAERIRLQESRHSVKSLQEETAALDKSLKALEEDAERVAVLQNNLDRMEEQKTALEAETDQCRLTLAEIEMLRTVLKTTRLKLDSGSKSRDAALREVESRQQLIHKVDEIRRKQDRLEAETASTQPALTKAEEELSKASENARNTEAQHRRIESLLGLLRADFDYYNDKLHLEQLSERKARIDHAREKAASAHTLLKRNRMDEPRLKAVRKAERAVDVALAKQKAGAPSVRLKTLANLSIQLDGQEEQLQKDHRQIFSVPDRLRLTIPDVLDLEVIAGEDASELALDLESARHDLERACVEAGITDPGEAPRAFEDRRKATWALESKKRLELENLRDLSYEQLAGKILTLEKRVPAYPVERVPEPPLPPDLESSKQALDIAVRSLDRARLEWETAHHTLDATRQVKDSLRQATDKSRIQTELNKAELERKEEELRQARTRAEDEVLAETLAATAGEVDLRTRQVREAEEALQTKGPDKAETLLEAAQGSLRTLLNKRKADEDELIRARTRLSLQGEEGLHEKLQAARSRLEHMERENEALLRRARAAKLLFEIMREERDKARRAYVAPLREQIERLGQLLFNETFGVEINEDLSIIHRNLNGISVPFDALSGGTREQLSLISRLACAMIVSKDGSGAPLILDDALGYTDPERLKLMGAVLALAGRTCQIIILTCQPDRYSHVGEVKTIRLGC